MHEHPLNEAQVHGKRKVKLLNHDETYEMSCPHLLFRILLCLVNISCT